MELFLLFELALLLAVLATAMVLTVVICAAGITLLASGMVSIAIVVGLARGKVLDGVRAFLLMGCILGGAAAGGGGALVAAKAWETMALAAPVLAAGAVCGILFGLAVALLADFALRKIANRVPKLRLPRTTWMSRANSPS